MTSLALLLQVLDLSIMNSLQVSDFLQMNFFNCGNLILKGGYYLDLEEMPMLLRIYQVYEIPKFFLSPLKLSCLSLHRCLKVVTSPLLIVVLLGHVASVLYQSGFISLFLLKLLFNLAIALC